MSNREVVEYTFSDGGENALDYLFYFGSYGCPVLFSSVFRQKGRPNEAGTGQACTGHEGCEDVAGDGKPKG